MDDDDSLLVDILTSKEEIALIEKSLFYLEAVNSGLFTPQTTGITVFLPLHYVALDGDESFEELWCRHVVKTNISFQGHGLMELTSLAGLVYTVDEDSVAGCPLSTVLSNVLIQGCMFHGVETTHLPELRPSVDSICGMGRVFLSGQHLPFTFEKPLGLEQTANSFTLFVTFNDNARNEVGEKSRVLWTGPNTVCRVTTPVLTQTAELMMWFRLYDNIKGYVVATRLWPWYIRVQANPAIPHDIAFDDFNPHSAKPNATLWLRGNHFSADSRVFIGREAALIHYHSKTLICCFVPVGTGDQVVKVCNAIAHRTHNRLFRYEK